MAEASEEKTIEITYSSPGACPPVYVGGTFTTPEWKLQELEYTIENDVSNEQSPEYTFFKCFLVGAGIWQYKFRLGSTGDWWVCDESKETVLDVMGNRNNLLIVESSANDCAESPDAPKYSDSFLNSESKQPMEGNQKGSTPSETTKFIAQDLNGVKQSRQANGDLNTSGEKGTHRFFESKQFSDGTLRNRNAAPREKSIELPEEADESVPPPPTIWQRFLQWMQSLLMKLFGA